MSCYLNVELCVVFVCISATIGSLRSRKGMWAFWNYVITVVFFLNRILILLQLKVERKGQLLAASDTMYEDGI